jgi:hypothetical protein
VLADHRCHRRLNVAKRFADLAEQVVFSQQRASGHERDATDAEPNQLRPKLSHRP